MNLFNGVIDTIKVTFKKLTLTNAEKDSICLSDEGSYIENPHTDDDFIPVRDGDLITKKCLESMIAPGLHPFVFVAEVDSPAQEVNFINGIPQLDSEYSYTGMYEGKFVKDSQVVATVVVSFLLFWDCQDRELWHILRRSYIEPYNEYSTGVALNFDTSSKTATLKLTATSNVHLSLMGSLYLKSQKTDGCLNIRHLR